MNQRDQGHNDLGYATYVVLHFLKVGALTKDALIKNDQNRGGRGRDLPTFSFVLVELPKQFP